ncbi:MAG: glycosyltransferase, partial [Bacteroidales bacterium]
MNGIVRIPFLSICIPTFNRAEHVFSLVKNILCCYSDEIEVVVLDNCSTDETKDLLCSIEDDRFIFVQNPENIGGLSNIIKVFTFANGVYALLCLDRDYIESQYILPLIDALRKDNNV